MTNIWFTNNTTLRMTTTKKYDNLNRLTSIVSSNSQLPSPISYAYAYNSANQRTMITNVDNSRWVYQYDALGQVISGKKYWADGSLVAGQQFEYGFDDIGNRKTTGAGGDTVGLNLRYASYTNNGLNQITGRSVPGYVNVLGTAKTNATVSIWGDNGAFSGTSRKGDYFRGELAATNTASALWLSITNLAVLNNGASADIVTNTVGKMFVPKTPEVFYYDLDGNLTNDGRWVYAWDAENRLTQVESLSSNPTASKRKVVWEFDGKGRRVRQTTSDKSSGSYVVTEDLKFVADGWRHIAELNATNNALVRSYTWGKDLSGSLDGAGGVGGLLMLNSVANGSHFYAYDGNGNVAALVKATDGSISQQCEYEPFGKLLRNTGLMANENKFLFSTKRNDATTDLLLYEYRVLKTDTGGWGSKDPIEERGGLNLYGFVGNRPLDRHDILGLANETGAVGLFFEWFTGDGDRHNDFGDGDSFAEELRNHGPVQEAIAKAQARTEEKCASCDKTDFNIPVVNDLGGIEGVPKYIRDYSTLLSAGMVGNLSATYLGSYRGSLTASGINCRRGAGRYSIVLTNTSHGASALRPPVIGYTQWWHENVEPAVNGFIGDDGPMSPTTQTITLTGLFKIKENCDCK